MTEWFHERYIERSEHEQIVAYYSKLVAQLYGQVKQLRAAGLEIAAIDAMVQHEQHKAEREIRRSRPAIAVTQGGNVVQVDFRARH
ncbi:hypothetical protein [Rhizobium sp.]